MGPFGPMANHFRKKSRGRPAQSERCPHPTDCFHMRQFWPALIIGATTLVCLAQEADTTFKVDVKLVNVFVTVTNAQGGPVSGLEKENFVLKEDGKEQKIATFSRESALPLSIVLAIDTSLSTRKDLPLEQSAAHKFAHTILRPQDTLALYKFAEEVNIVVPFTSDLGRIDSGIDHLRNGSATALFD